MPPVADTAAPDKSTLVDLSVCTYHHLSLELACDFDAKALVGTAAWRVTLAQPCDAVTFDTSGGLSVTEASVEGIAVGATLAPAMQAHVTAVEKASRHRRPTSSLLVATPVSSSA